MSTRADRTLLAARAQTITNERWRFLLDVVKAAKDVSEHERAAAYALVEAVERPMRASGSPLDAARLHLVDVERVSMEYVRSGKP